MPEDDPSVFKRFQLWLYTGSILEAPGQSASTIDASTLTDLYLFGEARGIPALQNAATNEVIDKIEESNTIPALEVRHVYDHTCEKSPMRRLYVDLMIYRGANLRNPTWGIGTSNLKYDYPVEFLMDLILAQYDILAVRPQHKDFSKDRQQYHVPTSGNGEHYIEI